MANSSYLDRVNQVENSEEMKTIHDMYKNTTDNGLRQDLRNNAERLRNNAGYMSDATGTNFTALPGDSRNTENPITPEEDPTKKMMDELMAAKRQRTYALLDQQLASGNSALDQEQSTIAPTYYGKRNQAAGQSDLAALNFAQRAAARGIKGNGGTMPEIYRNAALQGQIGALDQQEASANADIARRRTGLVDAYNANKLAADADIEEQGLQNYLNQMNANRQYDLALGQQTGTINGQDTLEKQQFDYNKSSTNPTVYAQILSNKKQELENKAQEIQNSYLPETLKLQAQRLAQQVQAGSLDYDTALAQLNKIRSSGSSGSTAKYDTNKNFNADDYAKYIESVYYQPEQIGTDANGSPKYSSRLVVSAQGKRDIASYLANLYQQGVDADIVNSLAAKYNISLQ